MPSLFLLSSGDFFFGEEAMLDIHFWKSSVFMVTLCPYISQFQ